MEGQCPRRVICDQTHISLSCRFSPNETKKLRAQDWHPSRKNLNVSEPDLSEDDDDDEAAQLVDSDEDGGVGSHRAGDEGNAGGGSTDQLEAAEQAMKREDDMTRDQKLSSFVKRYGIVAIAKSLQNDAHMTEVEFTALLREDCARTGRDFSKALEGGRFGDPGDIEIAKAWRAVRDAQLLSRTTTLSKAATLQPRQVGGADARAVDNPKAALDQINELVATQRLANPKLSEAQAFAQVYTDPSNATLVARERAENRPTATGW